MAVLISVDQRKSSGEWARGMASLRCFELADTFAEGAPSFGFFCSDP